MREPLRTAILPEFVCESSRLAVVNLAALRVFYHVVGRPFARGLVMPLFGVLFSLAMADAVIDWHALRAQAVMLSPPVAALAFTAAVFVWSSIAGHALRPVWAQHTIRFLVRQPLTHRQWALHLLLPTALAFMPVAALLWLLPLRAWAPAHYLGFAALAWPLLFGASYGGRDGNALRALGSAALMLLLWLYAYAGAAAYAAVAVALVEMPLAMAPLGRQMEREHPALSGSLRAGGIVGALMRRDLRCLLRTAGGSLTAPAVLAVVCALMMAAFAVNGGLAGRQALLAACILFTIAVSSTFECLEEMKMQLGKEFMRRRWPVEYRQRALALGGVIGVLVAPAALSTALAGTTMGAGNALLFALFVTTTVAACSLLLSAALRATSSVNGVFLLALIVHAGLVFTLPPLAYAGIALAAIAAGWVLTLRSLARFCAGAERVSLDSIA